MMPTCEIRVGDCLSHLATMPDNSVHCVVTSPPYYGLRDYGVEGQIGLEVSPKLFIEKMVEVFREIRRILRSDGTLWLNMGDSYASGGGAGVQGTRGQRFGRRHTQETIDLGANRYFPDLGIKKKDMMGIPWRMAFALQDDGWYLRQDIIWHKPNPMPESIQDRCCKSHEYIFLMSKSPRYFYDAEAVKEPVSGTANPRGSGVNAKIKMPDGWDTGKGGHGSFHRNGREKGKTKRVCKYGELSGHNTDGAHRTKANLNTRPKQNESFSAAVSDLVSMRHKRSVWTIPTEPCKDAHFATFPRALVSPCIQAGTSAGGVCSACGAPFVRIVEDGEPDLEHQRACGGDVNGEYHGKATKDYKAGRAEDPSEVKARILRGMVEKITTGWQPTCRCEEPRPVPATVLDPFGGSGTTGLVALELGRSAVLIELNPEYAEIARKRTNVTPGFAFMESSKSTERRDEA